MALNGMSIDGLIKMENKELQIQQVYSQIATRNTAAYDAAKKIYEAQNPFPKARQMERTDFLIVIAVFIIVTASIIVSGSRTIVEFGGGLIGVSAFVMIELAVVLYSFYRTRIHWTKERMESVKSLVAWGLGITVVIAITANVHATLSQNGVYIVPWIKTIILVIIAVSAPGLAWISGDILGVEYMRYLSNRREVDEENSRLEKEWWAGLNEKFQADEKKWGTSIRVQMEMPSLPQPSSTSRSGMENGNSVGNGGTAGYKRSGNATEISRNYFLEDISRLRERPAIAVEALKGQAGKSVVYKVWGEMNKELENGQLQ